MVSYIRVAASQPVIAIRESRALKRNDKSPYSLLLQKSPISYMYGDEPFLPFFMDAEPEATEVADEVEGTLL